MSKCTPKVYLIPCKATWVRAVKNWASFGQFLKKKELNHPENMQISFESYLPHNEIQQP